MPSPPHPAVRRCGPCRRVKLKCSFTLQKDICDRCAEKGHTCRPPLKGTPGVGPTARSLSKCDYCRTAHESCHPIHRVWPEKCEYCFARQLPCSVARTKKEFDDLKAQQAGTERTPETAVNRAPQNAEDAPTIPIAKSGLSIPEASDSEDSESSIPAPTIPPPKRKKLYNSRAESGPLDEVERLRTRLRIMENEFKEVLRTEQEKYRMDISELRSKHREELDRQREKYESRIDDLIKIMKGM